MKSIVRGFLWLSVVIAVVALVGCGSATPTSIKDRINKFESDLNSQNYGGLYKNFHEDSSAYTQRRDANTWTSDFPEDGKYTIDIDDIDGSTATGTITTGGGFYDGDSISFRMKDDPGEVGGLFGGVVENWKILSISGAVSVQ